MSKPGSSASKHGSSSGARKGKKLSERLAEEEAERKAEEAKLKAESDLIREEADTIRRLEELGLPTTLREDAKAEPMPSKEHLRVIPERKREYSNKLRFGGGGERGNTRLMWAAGHGMQDHIAVLLEQDVDVNEQNADGWTALFYACYNDRIECCRQLVGHGANVNIKAYDGTSPLMFAATAGKGNLRICQNLIEEGGADVNAVDRKGYTALMRATKKNNIDIVKCLLEYPQTDLNIADPQGITALIIAVNFGFLEIVQMLCSLPEILPPPEDKDKDAAGKGGAGAKGAKGDKDEKEGDDADKNKKKEKPKLIPGLQINKSDNEGYSALMYAAQTNNATTADIVECLLRMDGIAVNAASKDYSSALTIAVRYAHEGIVRQLLEHDPPGAEDKPSLRCDTNMFEPQRGTALITCVVDVPELSQQGSMDFWARRLRIAKMLIDRGASFYVTDIDERTPEETAAFYGQEELATYVREKRMAYDKAMG